MKLLDPIKKAMKLPDLRRRILITLLILFVFRVLAHIPLPGVNVARLKEFFASSQLLGLLDLFSGGGMQNFSLVTLGLNPYINASIIFQLLGMVFPKIEEMQKDNFGREKLNQYSRVVTFPLALLQAFGMYFLLSNQGAVNQLSWHMLAVLVVSMAAGTMVLMWLGELLTEYGLGNGISMIIFAGIVSRLPSTLGQTAFSLSAENLFNYAFFAALSVGLIALIVMVNEGVYKIPVQYARRAAGGRGVGTYKTSLPLKVNAAGVMPIIFAVSLVLMPGMIAGYLQNVPNAAVAGIATRVSQALDQRGFLYNALYFLLVFGFTYFYTTIAFNVERVADDLKKRGGFLPGIRPGKATSQYINYILNRITLLGAAFLGLVAILPSLASAFTGIANLSLGGTGILIVVSVVLETVRQFNSMLVTRSYEGFLD
ncbi:MAG: preprotein translocase subunit SecY [bacterium]